MVPDAVPLGATNLRILAGVAASPSSDFSRGKLFDKYLTSQIYSDPCQPTPWKRSSPSPPPTPSSRARSKSPASASPSFACCSRSGQRGYRPPADRARPRLAREPFRGYPRAAAARKARNRGAGARPGRRPSLARLPHAGRSRAGRRGGRTPPENAARSCSAASASARRSSCSACSKKSAASSGRHFFRLRALRVEGDGGANEGYERLCINVFAFVQVDRASDIAVEAGVEEAASGP